MQMQQVCAADLKVQLRPGVLQFGSCALSKISLHHIQKRFVVFRFDARVSHHKTARFAQAVCNCPT